MFVNQLHILSVLCVISFWRIEAKVTDLEYSLMPKLFQIDPYDLCMMRGKDALFCFVTVELSPINPTNYSEVWGIIKEVISTPRNYRHDRLRHGICIHNSCPELDNNVTFLLNNKDILKKGISQCYTRKYEDVGLKGEVAEMHCESVDPPIPIDEYDIAVLILYLIIIALAGYGTYYEGTSRYKSKEEYDRIIGTKYGQIVSCFSIRKNWDKLRSQADTPDKRPLKIINGVRFFGTFIVIAVHVCYCYLNVVENTKFIEEVTLNHVTMALTNATTAIQIFFVMTGLLITYNFLKTFEDKKDVPYSCVLLGFINRYIRLTPAYLVVLAFNATWLQHMSRGPLWHKMVEFEYTNCRKNWWANLLYINNFYDPQNMCMQHSWYLASDTQLFPVALLVMVFFWKHQNYVKLIFGTCLGIGVLVSTIINYVYDFDIIIRQYPEAIYTIFLDSPQWHMMYSSSYSNITGYVVGMIFGYIFYKYRDSQVFTKRWHTVAWWILLFGLPLGIMSMGMVFYNPSYIPNRISSAIYAGLSKPIFVFGLAFGVFGASKNVGWILRDLFLWRPLQPLGRLTYCVYLVHFSLLRIRSGISRSPIYASYYLIFTSTIETLITAYAGALVLCLLVEMPFSALQNVFTRRMKTDKNPTSVKTLSNGVSCQEDKHTTNS